ncbi:hypothetical protein DKT77_20130 [Meridianimarinicoccus roseus]|jgi:hypothetical protein|uniref:YdhG-like domain-containing protein n=1 Tax=Meridianimarinicoccus roseus TaxID=2072018 RepID=A0A2V2L617_9RHOB|nr:DUF1801 domain-containing protein [Meridianimarinicoccus roseus]PWR00838.1 hypothetical protein DKT77_20130 [Meridianimarinicoccus roseus]
MPLPPPDTPQDVADFLNRVAPPARRDDALQLDAIFRIASSFPPRLWPGGIVGYGRYDYIYESGRSGRSLATGFAPRARQTVVYIMPGYADFRDLLARLGPVKSGKACLYMPRLDRVDTDVLAELIRAGLEDLARRWTIHPV